MIDVKIEILTSILKAVSREYPNAIIAVTKEGPIPLAVLIIKFAAVRVAPLLSGGFTFMSTGRTLTEGRFATMPERNEKKQGTNPAVEYDAFNIHKKGSIPSKVDKLMKIGI